ncbi:YdcF family protein [Aporhodopirellula aestuarii]|uniref:YdcF family protein n=1 Tax=Aporhodopirellula aestuarii TaxID=2950107 RepID=A0ABT0UAC7_9BACT|nr:YdcF family protein [Aporhodopirellula aestuarii]MCM2373820.1 YdcF family protein [Aporhodopirellula aestuarii]
MKKPTDSAIDIDRVPHSDLRRLLTVAAITSLLPVGLVLATYLQQGFVAAGRGATNLVMPVSLVWLSLLAATLWHAYSSHRGKTVIFFTLFIAWTVVGNCRFSQTLMSCVEAPLIVDPHPALEQRVRKDGEGSPELPLDAVVALGGCARLVMDGFGEVTSDGERIVSAAQAYHAGATKTIITTGSSTDGIGDPWKLGRDLLISLNVPAEHIFSIEEQNTSQEMASLAAFLKDPPADWLAQIGRPASDSQRVGLITSAFHIPRAIRLAKSNGLELLPLPCAFRSERTEKPFVAAELVPNSESHVNFSLAAKELLARILGR